MIFDGGHFRKQQQQQQQQQQKQQQQQQQQQQPSDGVNFSQRTRKDTVVGTDFLRRNSWAV